MDQHFYLGSEYIIYVLCLGSMRYSLMIMPKHSMYFFGPIEIPVIKKRNKNTYNKKSKSSSKTFFLKSDKCLNTNN